MRKRKSKAKKWIKIEEVSLDDILNKDLRPLDWIMWRHHWSGGERARESFEMRKDIFRKAYKTGNYGLIIARETDTDTIVAFLDYQIIYDPIENFPIAFLQNMRTIEHMRSRGIGRELVKKLREICERRGVREVHVVAGPGAEDFYQKKCGFHYKDTFLEAETEDVCREEE